MYLLVLRILHRYRHLSQTDGWKDDSHIGKLGLDRTVRSGGTVVRRICVFRESVPSFILEVWR